MATLMQVDVVSPDEELFSGEATFVLARTVEGDIGILANHVPLLAELAPYDVKIHAPSGDVHFPIAGGFMSVKDNKVIILAAGAIED
ncbi:MAG TPA: F0F1 ATP synthase subunit epsilon [Actinomycetota bacterium]